MNKQPLVISIDGNDACGKTTTIDALCEILFSQYKLNVKRLKFPAYDTPTGKLIKDYLNGNIINQGESMDPYAEYMMFNLDRRVYYKNNLDNLLEYDVIVLDRSYLSGLFYTLANLCADQPELMLQELELLLTLEFRNSPISSSALDPYTSSSNKYKRIVLHHNSFDNNLKMLNMRNENKDVFESDIKRLNNVYNIIEAMRLFNIKAPNNPYKSFISFKTIILEDSNNEFIPTEKIVESILEMIKNDAHKIVKDRRRD